MFPSLAVFPIFRSVHSLRESDILYTLIISMTDGTAEVTATDNRIGSWDVAFGSRYYISNLLAFLYDLNPGETEIPHIWPNIMNDIHPEDNETFTLKVSPRRFGGIRHNFECYDDGETPVEGNFFCSHTVTIVDEDGQFRNLCSTLLVVANEWRYGVSLQSAILPTLYVGMALTRP